MSDESKPTEFDKAFMELMKQCKSSEQGFHAMFAIFYGLIHERIQNEISNHVAEFHKEQIEEESGKGH